ncbi:hypothetical protein [Nonomuraea sp. NPDC003709]|uniref:hypothetical protein n=1 Tax=Nonomuraea sp. NPDC003709 TaxID=3154450 RepID=UPI0033A3723B
MTLDYIAFGYSMPAWDAGEHDSIRATLAVSVERLARAGAGLVDDEAVGELVHPGRDRATAPQVAGQPGAGFLPLAPAASEAMGRTGLGQAVAGAEALMRPIVRKTSSRFFAAFIQTGSRAIMVMEPVVRGRS